MPGLYFEEFSVGQTFDHKWQLVAALEDASDAWQKKEPSPLTKDYNKKLAESLDYLFRLFAVPED